MTDLDRTRFVHPCWLWGITVRNGILSGESLMQILVLSWFQDLRHPPPPSRQVIENPLVFPSLIGMISLLLLRLSKSKESIQLAPVQMSVIHDYFRASRTAWLVGFCQFDPWFIQFTVTCSRSIINTNITMYAWCNKCVSYEYIAACLYWTATEVSISLSPWLEHNLHRTHVTL